MKPTLTVNESSLADLADELKVLKQSTHLLLSHVGLVHLFYLELPYLECLLSTINLRL